MTLLKKIRRLFLADTHAWIDGLENPLHMIDQLIREMEDDLKNRRVEITQKDADLKLKEQKQRKFLEKMKVFDDDINFALKNSSEDLAKTSIRKVILLGKNQEALDSEIKLLSEQLSNFKSTFEKDQKDLEALKLQRETVALTQKNKMEPDDSLEHWDIDHEVELEFLRRLQAEGRSS